MRSAGAVLHAICVCLCWQAARGTAQGAIKLDNYTFDKALAIPGITFLVKFDRSYAYGEKEDQFKELCKLAYSVPQFLIAEVPVQEYGDKENDDLRERFGMNKDDFPTYMLFNKANEKGIKYSGDIKAENIVSFLRKNQVRMPSIGTIDELDSLALQFLKEGLADTHLQAAKKLAEDQYSTDRKAAMYVKIMQKIKEKGETYVSAETERVTKILQGKVSAEKKAEMEDKMKVLGVFATKDDL